MSYQNGPRIVTDRLVLYLDAGNSKSYPGVGTMWFDLSGNNLHATLIDNIQHNTNGYFILDGSQDGAQINNFPAVFSNSVTMTGWFYFDINNTRDVLFGSFDDAIMDISFERHTSNRLRLYWNNGINDIFSSNNIAPANRWLYISIIRNKEMNAVQFYIDGKIVSSTNVVSSDILTNNLTFRIGRDTRTDFTNMNGKISSIKIYNKALSGNEIQQNYNALKGRFSL